MNRMDSLSLFGTTVPSTPWTESQIGKPAAAATTTTAKSHVVMVQVKSVAGKNGLTELAASIDPASLGRKLAVMRVSAELDGLVITSTAA